MITYPQEKLKPNSHSQQLSKICHYMQTFAVARITIFFTLVMGWFCRAGLAAFDRTAFFCGARHADDEYSLQDSLILEYQPAVCKAMLYNVRYLEIGIEGAL